MLSQITQGPKSEFSNNGGTKNAIVAKKREFVKKAKLLIRIEKGATFILVRKELSTNKHYN